MKKDIDDILAAYLNKAPLTEEERQEFEAWKNSSVHNKKVGKLIVKLEKQKQILARHQSHQVVFNKVQHQVRQSKRKRQLIFWSSCAAGIILFIGFFFLLRTENTVTRTQTINQTYISGLALKRPAAELILPDGRKRLLSQEKKAVIVSDSNREMRTDQQTLIVESNTIKTRETEYYTINIPYGAEYNLVLSDGSKIYLNAGSTLRYPDQFIGDKREVFLTGEAYFEVKSDSLHPFIVHASDVAIRVLGTSFNVNTYKKNVIETSLLTGRIKISGGSLPQEYVLTPGKKATYSSIDKTLKITKADAHVITGWCDDYLIFDSEPLIDVIEEIERWYGVKIELRCPQIGQDLLSGSFRHESIQNVIHSLSLQYKFRYEIHKDKITIY